MEKKKAEAPVIEVVVFEAADVITASDFNNDEWD